MNRKGIAGITSLAQARVAVVGLGLMGGSLALALHGHCACLMGIDPDPQVLRLAKQRGVVDLASQELKELLPEADIVVLAAPVLAILDLLKNLDRFHPAPAVVLDLGSTKAEIVRAMADLPDRFDPIGGHPMCGKENASLINADPELYRGAVFALVPLPRTSLHARSLAQELVAILGSQALWLDSIEHDRWVAATSHLPYLLANALTLAVPGEAAPLAGPGFMSTSRLAGSYTPMMLDVLQTNRQNILEALRGFRASLDEFERCLEQGDFDHLSLLLQNSAHQHIIFSGKGAA